MCSSDLQGRIRYSGSPIPLSFTESAYQHQVLLLEFSEGQLQSTQSLTVPRTIPLLTVPERGFAPLPQVLQQLESLRNLPALPLERQPFLRINVLANFDDEQMEGYIASHKVILNPLHKQGYSTIGCNRCTTPVLPGEPKRAGRWRHLGPWSVYCGINPTDMDPQRAPAVDFPQDLIDRILGRSTDFMI